MTNETGGPARPEDSPDDYLWLDSLDPDTVARHTKRVLALLTSPDELVRLEAVRAAGRGGLAEEIYQVARTEQDPLVLAEAVELLGELEFEPAQEFVKSLAVNNEEHLVKGSAAVALSEILGTEATDSLLALTKKEEDSWVRASIGCALAWLGATDATPIVQEALASEDLRVRRMTANRIRNLPPSNHRDLLRRLLETAIEREQNEVARDELSRALAGLS